MSFISKRLLLSKKTTTQQPVAFDVAYCTRADCCINIPLYSDDCMSICVTSDAVATVYATAGSTFTTGTILYKDPNLTQIFTGEGTWLYMGTPDFSCKNVSTGAVYKVIRATGQIGAFEFNC